MLSLSIHRFGACEIVTAMDDAILGGLQMAEKDRLDRVGWEGQHVNTELLHQEAWHSTMQQELNVKT